MAVRHDRPERTERVERVEHFHESAAPSTNVTVGPRAQSELVTGLTRVVTLVFTVLQVLLLLRFTFKLGGANANQPLVAALYGLTEPLVRPFQGIFPEPQAGVIIDIAALLAILFLFLIGALLVALVRAIAGRAY